MSTFLREPQGAGGDGSIKLTWTPDPQPDPEPIVLTQTPVNGCAKVRNNKIPRDGLRRILKPGCVTNAGEPTKVRVRGGLRNRGDVTFYKVIRKTNGKVKIRTFGYKLKLKVIWKAKATGEYAKYKKTRAYKI